MIDTNTVFSVIAVLISVGGFIIAILAHKRNRRLENENHLYKLKIEVYNDILREMSRLLDMMDEAWHYVNGQKGKFSDDEKEEFEQMVDEINDGIIDFSSFITSKSLLIPTKLVEMLEIFDMAILKSNIEKNTLQIENKIIDECNEKADKILSEMRKDLNIDTLNVLLFNRIKK